MLLPDFVQRATRRLCSLVIHFVAKPAVLQMLSGIKVGNLAIVDEVNQQKYIFGQSTSIAATGSNKKKGDQKETLSSTVQIAVKDDWFWLRVFLFADTGFAKAYVLGHVDCSDLVAFFSLFIMNRSTLKDGSSLFSGIYTILSFLGSLLIPNTNTQATSKRNTAAHYDISNDVFSAFLSDDMTYSCPIWTDNADETLEQAQHTKLMRFIQGAKIQRTDHVLEIGTGWGSFAIEAVKSTGCRVTSITLSRNQRELALQRIEAAGLSDRIEVLFADYRDLKIDAAPYDKIVSIEMIEAVGEAHLAEYFRVVDRLLKREGGVAMFQCITLPECLHSATAMKGGFVAENIFPGGYLPHTTQLINHITTQSAGTLILQHAENIGPHYAKALSLWREKMLANFEARVRPALLASWPDMSENEVETFRKKWEYYFSYCEAGFATKTLGDVIITVERVGGA